MTGQEPEVQPSRIKGTDVPHCPGARLFTLSSFPRSSGLPRPRRSEETCPSSRWLGGAIWQIALSIVGFLGSSAARRSRCDGPLTNSDQEDDVDVHSAGALRGADLVLALVAALQRQALIDDHAYGHPLAVNGDTPNFKGTCLSFFSHVGGCKLRS